MLLLKNVELQREHLIHLCFIIRVATQLSLCVTFQRWISIFMKQKCWFVSIVSYIPS